VQSDDLSTDLPQTLVAMITSNMTRAGHPSRLIVQGDRRGSEASGLLMDSIIVTDNLAQFATRRLVGFSDLLAK